VIRPDLLAHLRAAQIPADAYSLDGELRDDALVLDHVGHEWVAFQLERGARRDERRFASESEANAHVLDTLLRTFGRDTTRRPLRAADYELPRLRVRRVPDAADGRRRYEVELTEPGADHPSWTRETSDALGALEPCLGVADAHAVRDAADRAWRGGTGPWESLFGADRETPSAGAGGDPLTVPALAHRPALADAAARHDTRESLRGTGSGRIAPGRGAGPAPWPRPVRYTLLALLFAVIGIGLVTVLYDKGILPIAGPFALIFLLPVLLPLQRRGIRKRRERLADRLHDEGHR
jgi:hypothetical protein